MSDAREADAFDHRQIDLMAMAWCSDCETHAEIDETNIDDETHWVKESCECGEVEVTARVAPWPRNGMEWIDGEWQWPEIANREHPGDGGGDTLVTE